MLGYYLEISKKNGVVRSWTAEQIKKAFNFGKGTEEDFKNYMNNNKQFCKFKKISEFGKITVIN